jgi:hypothetical protein
MSKSQIRTHPKVETLETLEFIHKAKSDNKDLFCNFARSIDLDALPQKFLSRASCNVNGLSNILVFAFFVSNLLWQCLLLAIHVTKKQQQPL